ncbi:MAG: pyruvate, phosphate dikinase, partial [Chlamydiia bacterium]|nr:pyruvate, phosphate dikinase [Chlamydiia bacterium]
QDIEFTIDDGRLFMLQTRTGKRTGFAAIKVAIDMIDEGLIDEETALLRVTPEQFTQLLAPIFEMSEKRRAYKDMVAKGLNAGPGAASGRIALTTKQAEMWRQEGISCILVREETNPNDFPGIVAADGVLTARGGSTSHAAVVARGMGKPCVVGCADLDIDLTKRQIRVGSRVLSEGDILSIDGTTGEIYFCALNTSASEIIQVLLTKRLRPEESKFYPYFDRLMRLADKYRKLKIRTNADTIADTNAAFAFGAEGIGLCRTEHMLMQPERLLDVRRMFFSTDPESRQKAIERLLPHQKRDFLEIFKAANGRPVTIRLLDPPLHEFLPHNRYDLQQLASDMNIEIDVLIGIDKRLREQNPMLGFRGCRLGILYPRITEVQVQAILEAALELQDQGVEVNVEIMVPLIQSANEFQHQKALIDTTAKRIFDSKKKSIHYLVGTMIELPRAALTADEIARDAEFFSFGTNDLTQTTLGISRDDSMRFVPLYIEGVSLPTNHKVKVQIMECDPFQCLDEKGVGRLMRLAVDEGRKTRRDLKCGICGEHGGDPETVEFCQRIGINYVSCSPYRVPLARLAAAQAAIRESK